MADWYGESYRLDGGTVLSGGIDLSMWRYHFDNTSAVLGGGDEVIVGAYADSNDLAAFAAFDQPIVARWVFEVASAGSVAVRAGFDPSWTYTDPLLATQDLGTLTATGPSTLVSDPIDGITLASLAAQDVPVIAHLSGDGIDIMQVKLRVWPAAGVSGAWVRGPNWRRQDTDVDRWYAAHNEGTLQMPTFEQAWDKQRELVTNWSNVVGVQYTRNPGGSSSVSAFFYVFDNQLTAPFTPSGSAGVQIAVVVANPGGPSLPPPLTGGIDPNEVGQEELSRIRSYLLDGVTYGPAVTKFDGWDDAAVITTERETWLSGEALPAGNPKFTPDPTDPTLMLGRFYFVKSWLRTTGSKRLALLGNGKTMAFSVMGDAYWPPAPEADTFTTAGATLSDLLPFFTRIENYSYYDPAATATPTRKPRFYVTFTEVDDDPRDVSHVVGIGKPANDTSIFRVPTPLGTLRELRPGEKVSDVSVAYPLKVKLEDGSWTVVAGMTPDA